MYCKNCGKEISNDAIFCSGCGIQVANEKARANVDEQAVDQDYYSTLFVEKDEMLIAKYSNEAVFDNSSYVKGIKAGRFSALLTDKRLYLRGVIGVSKQGKRTLKRSVYGISGRRVDKVNVDLKSVISADVSARMSTLRKTIGLCGFLLMSLFCAYVWGVLLELKIMMWVMLGLFAIMVSNVIVTDYLYGCRLTVCTNEEIVQLLIGKNDRSAIHELQKKIFYAKSQLKSSSEMQQDAQ